MTYEITKSDGNILAYLKDGLIDQNSSSLIFVGKNVVNYGQIQNNNFLHLLENFAAPIEPLNKLTGQLWLDTTTHTLKLYHQNSWQTISTMSYSASSARANNQGNLWYDTANRQLFINNGSGFDLIGPDKSPGFATTRWVSDVLADTTNRVHAVIKCVLDSEVIAIITKDSFTINSSTSVTGFLALGRGMNFKNGSSTDVQLYGISQFAFNANALKNQVGDAFITPSVSSVANSIMQRDASGNTNISKLTATELASNNGVLSGEWQVNNDFTPTTNGNLNLGAADLAWANVYAQNLRATTLNVTNANATNVNFTTLKDSLNTAVTKFDKDVTLAANSDSNVTTQRAVKKYIDDAVAAEVAARIGAIDGVQNQINVLKFVPAGCVFYTASATVPDGYLPADGRLVSRGGIYENLFMAIGTTYGGNGNPNFNLPDLRGEFIRGWDGGRGVESRNLGSFQNQSFASHTHPYVDTYYREAPKYGGNGNNRGVGSNSTDYDNSDLDYQRTTGSTGGTETRPRNVALYAIIKY